MQSSLFARLGILAMWLVTSIAYAQDKPAYVLYTKEGKPVDYDKMVKVLSKADIVLFGELHDNAIDHWLELQVLKDIYALRPDLSIGMEMFESDDQIVVNEYLQGLIDERLLLNEAKVWDNYKNDYKPIMEFAKEKKLPLVATNIPRRYANMVYKKGVEVLTTLPEEARRWIAPLPVTIDLNLPGYKNMMSMGTHGGPSTSGSAENMARSQAMKDATMAHFLLQYRKGLAIHYHGAYHSQNFEGIMWYLKAANPQLNIVTIHSVEQDNVGKLEDANKNTADYIICIPKDMTKTY